MGDRANIGFTEHINSPVINLYTHWHGSERRELLAWALEKSKPRWADPSYATRIAISQIVGEDWDKETGWGLMVDSFGDNEHPYLLVVWNEQKVLEFPTTMMNVGKSGLIEAFSMTPRELTFDEFITQYSGAFSFRHLIT